MAVYTELSIEDADRVARAHGLGAALTVEGVLAGSVNSNFFVDAEARRVFVRIYEEQDEAGVRYEWALLDHLRALPVPRRVEGPAPGVVRVAGKCTACFELMAGEEVCQSMVSEPRAAAVGCFLARAHRVGASFGTRRAGRFTRADVRARLEGVAALQRPELAEAVALLGRTIEEVDAAWDETLPRGVVHGDLFRDNVRWEGEVIVGALDWESASDGLFVYDLAVTALAWCFGDRFDAALFDAMVAGYESVRPLEARERDFLPVALQAAATRFTVTRITDFHLRDDAAQVKKDWRRFLARLEAVRTPLERA